MRFRVIISRYPLILSLSRRAAAFVRVGTRQHCILGRRQGTAEGGIEWLVAEPFGALILASVG
jgi:hypothetical protein